MGSKRNGRAQPKFALGDGRVFYVTGKGTGTQKTDPKHVADIGQATHWPSKYAAKQARDALGLDAERWTARRV